MAVRLGGNGRTEQKQHPNGRTLGCNPIGACRWNNWILKDMLYLGFLFVKKKTRPARRATLPRLEEVIAAVHHKDVLGGVGLHAANRGHPS